MASIENGSRILEEREDSGEVFFEKGIDPEQMESNGITLIDFSDPPEGIVLLGKPFPADFLWHNLSQRPRK